MPLNTLSMGHQYRSLIRPTPYPRFTNVEVHNSYNCPNFRCTIDTPHVYQDLTSVPIQPSHIPLLSVRRFPINTNPFPKMNRWEIERRPRLALENGSVVFLARYGVVTLQDVEDDVANGASDWRVFQCMDERGFVVAEVVSKTKWCKRKKEHYGKYRFVKFIPFQFAFYI